MEADLEGGEKAELGKGKKKKGTRRKSGNIGETMQQGMEAKIKGFHVNMRYYLAMTCFSTLP